ncbi:hypothetical protein BC830DRAFT_663262 [Chytriomyces sp. MP71]|nr:hypothetical protein BC830DRAFT_663262 [Chytriomyces sp. MP71]
MKLCAMIRTEGCTACRQVRKGCSRTLPCTRCSERNLTCEYSATGVVEIASAPFNLSSAVPEPSQDGSPPPLRPCVSCKTHKKRCDPCVRPCRRCVKRGVACLESKSLTAQRQENSPQASTQLLVRIPRRSQTPDSPHPMGQSSLHSILSSCVQDTLEDPSLMPSMQDFATVYNFYATSANQMFILREYGGILNSFFSEPPYIRLTLCAIAAHLSIPRLPDHMIRPGYSA